MTTQITINPLPQNTPPGQLLKATAPQTVNNDFFSSFSDLLGAVNPLQHIPVVSTIYREATGDTLSEGARILGGALFGGPIGLFASIIDTIVESQTGKDIGGNLFAAATGKYGAADKLG